MTSPSPDIEQPKQSVQSAWVLRLRREAERVQCDDMARITFVGLLIATHTDAKGGGAFMAPATLAGISGYSVDMVRRCIAALVAVGLLVRRRRQGTTSIYQLLLPATSDALDWHPHLQTFEQARQAAAARRARSAARAAKASTSVATDVENTRRDGAPESRTPVASGDSEHPSRRGTQDSEHPSRRPENTRRVGGFRTPVASGGYLDQSSTCGRDPDNYQERAGLVAQPQVGARDADATDQPSPGLQALPGGGRGPAGAGHQGPLLLSVPQAPPLPLDARLLADRLTALYGVPVRRDQALRLALDVLGDSRPHDPTTAVLDAIEADPEQHRPHLPVSRHTAAGGTA